MQQIFYLREQKRTWEKVGSFSSFWARMIKVKQPKHRERERPKWLLGFLGLWYKLLKLEKEFYFFLGSKTKSKCDRISFQFVWLWNRFLVVGLFHSLFLFFFSFFFFGVGVVVVGFFGESEVNCTDVIQANV